MPTVSVLWRWLFVISIFFLLPCTGDLITNKYPKFPHSEWIVTVINRAFLCWRWKESFWLSKVLESKIASWPPWTCKAHFCLIAMRIYLVIIIKFSLIIVEYFPKFAGTSVQWVTDTLCIYVCNQNYWAPIRAETTLDTE